MTEDVKNKQKKKSLISYLIHFNILTLLITVKLDFINKHNINF